MTTNGLNSLNGNPIDPELNGILYRIYDDFEEMIARINDAITASGVGPGTCEAHILTRNRISRAPVRLDTTATIADEDVVALRRMLRNAKDRARHLADTLDVDLGYRPAKPAAKTTAAQADVRNAKSPGTAHVHAIRNQAQASG